nr:restriction endonuclease subunit S [Acinetobacter soli]
MSVPKLRFKEFDGAWSETLFQDLFIFKNGVNASKEQYGSGIKFINVLDIINNPNGITYDSIIGSVNITSKEIDKNLVKYGDVLFQRSSETREEVGQSNVYLGKDPVVFGGFVIRGSAQNEYDPIFMNGLLKTDSLRDQITQLSGGSTRFNIGQDSLNKVSAYLPLKEEQTKIASFLSAVDEKMSQLTQKHKLLSQYKQGMMQKLFSQQIRFKADKGNEFGEWGNSYIGDVCKITTGNKDTQNKVDDGEYPFFVRSQKVERINSYSMDCEGLCCTKI